VLLAADDPDHPEGREKLLAHVKCNQGALAPTLRYEIDSEEITQDGNPIVTSRIRWQGDAPGVYGGDLLVREDQESRRDKVDAMEWLEEFLGDGQQPTLEVFKDGTKEGFSRATLKRAKKALRVLRVREGFGGSGRWLWKLPEPPSRGDQAYAIESQYNGIESLCKTNGEKPSCEAPLPIGAHNSDIEPLRASEAEPLCVTGKKEVNLDGAD
jgi:hypothetical protein